MTTQQTRECSDLDSLRESIKPFSLAWYPTLDSTSTKAAEIANDQSITLPFVVLTERQTAGRGRGSNTWDSPPGVLTATFALSTDNPYLPQHVPLLAGLAVREACQDLGASSAGLKWPNDVWADGLKVAGLLCERIHGVDLIGIGLNVCNRIGDMPVSNASRCTTVSRMTGKDVSEEVALVAVAGRLATYLIGSIYTIEESLQAYSDHLVLMGRKIRVNDPGISPGNISIEGYCEGIDKQGRLLLRNTDGQHAIVAGRVYLVS